MESVAISRLREPGWRVKEARAGRNALRTLGEKGLAAASLLIDKGLRIERLRDLILRLTREGGTARNRGCLLEAASEETKFEILLTEVDRLEDGQVTPVPFEGPGSDDLARGFTRAVFGKEGLRVEVRVLSSRIEFAITNETERPARVFWDRFAYTGADGVERVGYITADPSVGNAFDLPPGVRELFLGRPPGYAPPDGDRAGFPAPPPSLNPAAQRNRERYCDEIGKTLEMRLPVELEGRTAEYRLRFRIEDILVVTYLAERSLRARPWGGCPSAE